MDDIKLFTKKEKELETAIQAVRIYCENIGLEFGMEICAMLIIKCVKRQMTEVIELSNQSSSSSSRAASTDILDHLSPLFPIVHHLRKVFWVTSCVLT